MRAMVLEKTGTPLASRDVPKPKLLLILGHEMVARVEQIGENVNGFAIGDRVGILISSS